MVPCTVAVSGVCAASVAEQRTAIDNTVARNRDITLHPELSVRFIGENNFCTTSIQEKGLLLPAVVTGLDHGYALAANLIFVAKLDLIFDVVIDRFRVEGEKRQMSPFKLLVERLQIGLLQLLPLIEQAR